MRGSRGVVWLGGAMAALLALLALRLSAEPGVPQVTVQVVDVPVDAAHAKGKLFRQTVTEAAAACLGGPSPELTQQVAALMVVLGAKDVGGKEFAGYTPAFWNASETKKCVLVIWPTAHVGVRWIDPHEHGHAAAEARAVERKNALNRGLPSPLPTKALASAIRELEARANELYHSRVGDHNSRANRLGYGVVDRAGHEAEGAKAADDALTKDERRRLGLGAVGAALDMRGAWSRRDAGSASPDLAVRRDLEVATDARPPDAARKDTNPGVTCTPPTGATPCVLYLTKTCCKELLECGADASCKAALDLAQACRATNPGAVGPCWTTFAQAGAKAQALYLCVYKQCPNDCV